MNTHEAKLCRLMCSPNHQTHLLFFATVLNCSVPILEALFFSRAYYTRGRNYSSHGFLAAAVERMAALYPKAQRIDECTFRCGVNTVTLRTWDGGIKLRCNGALLQRIVPWTDGPLWHPAPRPGLFESGLDRILFEIVGPLLVPHFSRDNE